MKVELGYVASYVVRTCVCRGRDSISVSLTILVSDGETGREGEGRDDIFFFINVLIGAS